MNNRHIQQLADDGQVEFYIAKYRDNKIKRIVRKKVRARLEKQHMHEASLAARSHV